MVIWECFGSERLELPQDETGDVSLSACCGQTDGCYLHCALAGCWWGSYEVGETGYFPASRYRCFGLRAGSVGSTISLAIMVRR